MFNSAPGRLGRHQLLLPLRFSPPVGQLDAAAAEFAPIRSGRRRLAIPQSRDRRNHSKLPRLLSARVKPSKNVTFAALYTL
jgi:hypothetical protein